MFSMYDAYHLISTPENVDLRLELAGVGNRVLACFIDTTFTYISIALLWVSILLTYWLLGYTSVLFHFESLAKEFIGGIVIIGMALGLLATFVITFGYFILFEGLWQGQTPGKKIAGIRVVRENGEPISWQASFLRNMLRTFDEGMFFIGLIFMVVEKDEKRMGDLAAGTIVIRERKVIQLLLPNTAADKNMSQDGFATALSANELDQTDHELLSSFLRRRKFMLKQQRTELAKQLADYLSTKLNNQPQNNSTNPEIYLEQLL